MISKASIKRPVTTVMVILMIFLAGTLAYNNLELAYLPSMDAPMALISTTYSGTGPEEMAELITKPIEEAVATLTGVDSISSTSSVGSSIVMIEFVDGTDLDNAAQDLREKLDMVKSSLPDDANDPTVLKMDMNSESISIGITSDLYDVDTLYNLLDENVTNRFERIDGISSVSISGGRESEIQIIVNPEKMDGYGVTINQIRQSLRAENANTPAGEILQGDTDLQLRTIGEFKSVNEIADLVISTNIGNVIHLSDVAEVKEVKEDKNNASLINGREGVIYSLSKQSDANIVTVSDEIIKAMNEIKRDYPEFEIELLTTTADYIKTSINNVVTTAFQSAFIAVIILLIFLRDPKTSIIIGISIPTSIVATFGMMYLMGMTMNTISMGGIVIGIGMLVDNSVVVLENIYTYWKKGLSPKEAAIRGAGEVSMAVTASTLTTIAVFIPLTFVSGMIGQILQDIAYTICFALIASLVVSLTFVPMACSRLLSKEEKKLNKKKTIFSYLGGIWLYGLESLDKSYKKILKLTLKFRITTVIIVICCFILSLSIIPLVGMDLISSTDEGTASISISMPNGTKYELAEEMVYEVLNKIDGIPETEMIFATIGSGRGGFGGNSQAGSVTINLVDEEERTRSTDEVVEELKERLKNIAGAEITVSASANAMGSMGGGSSLSLKVMGDETDTLRQISDDLITLISEIPGARDVETSLDDSISEGNIILNRAKASKYGITTSEVASTVNAAVSGSVATQYKIDGTEIDVRIKYDDNRIKFINDLSNISFTTAQGNKIPLTEIADIQIGESAVSIRREDQQRYITITADFMGVDTNTVQSLVQEKLHTYIFPDNYYYEFGGNMKMMQESFSSLANVLLIAIILVYMIMASQFESVIYPFIVMFSMPLAITGGIIGLFVTGQSITVTAFMGFIMLVGMVVNNAIVLVDYTNQLVRERGLECNDALIEAGPSRLRPILMTTLTTVIGLMPMALATSSGMEIQQPLGISVIFGLSISTFVTLLFIPVLYSLFNSASNRVKLLVNNIKRIFYKEDISSEGEL